MSESWPQIVEEEYGPADLPRGPLLGDPRASMDTLESSNSHSTYPGSSHGSDRRSSSFLSALFHTLNLSTPSVRSNLFTHSWHRLGTYDIPDLCSYMEFAPPTPIVRLKWCKNQDRLKHEFLLLEVKRPDNRGTIWLRLERRMHENASVLKSISRPVPSGDTAKICNNISRLFDPSRSPVQVETEFADPPLLQRLGNLLSILKEESPNYKLPSENCYFFCAVIYEILFSIGKGMNVTGTPSKFSLSRGAEVKERIKKRMETWAPESSLNIPSLEDQDPLPTEGTSVSSPLPTERHPPANKYEDHPPPPTPKVESKMVASPQEPTPQRPMKAVRPEYDAYDRKSGINSRRSSLKFNKGQKPDRKMSTRDPPPRLARWTRSKSEPGTVPESLVPRMNFAVPYDDQLVGGNRNLTKSSPHAPGGRSDLSQGEGLLISIDLGTTYSAVAFGTSASPKVSQICYWPGSSHPLPRVPTCVVYDKLGDVRAWGVEATQITLREGWVRSEWFKLGLDPSFVANDVHTMLPFGKKAADVVVDYLSSLWLHAKKQIMQKNTLDDLIVANVYLTVPSSWDARICLILREVSIKSGLVAQIASQDTSWMDRLHIIAEPEASAVYCVSSPQTIGKLESGQQLMVCNAGGAFVDMAVYNVLRWWGTPEIVELCLRSSSHCGSLFLDLRFRDLICFRLAGHPSHLDAASLAHFLLIFEMEKKNFGGPADDDKNFHFRCLRLQDLHDPAIGLENGELIIPGSILRRKVFDPVITQVLEAIEQQLQIFNARIDMLVLVGGFASSDYLFRRVKEAFGRRIGLISRPLDGDLSSVRGGASAGLLAAANKKPLVTCVVALQSFIMRVRLPAEPQDKMLRPTYIASTAGVQVCENRVQYVVHKGAEIRRGQRIEVELRKFSTSSFDRLFQTVLYTSNSDRIMRYADEGETTELCKCYVDLSPLPNFQKQARSIPSVGFYTDFELGFELDTPEVRGVLRYKGHDYGPIGFEFRS